MTENKLFIASVLMLIGLIGGASYLQKTYDTEGAPIVSSNTSNTPSTPTVAAANDTSGWQISTSTAPTKPASAVSTPVASPAPTTPAPAVRRAYTSDDDRGDDN